MDHSFLTEGLGVNQSINPRKCFHKKPIFCFGQFLRGSRYTFWRVWTTASLQREGGGCKSVNQPKKIFPQKTNILFLNKFFQEEATILFGTSVADPDPGSGAFLPLDPGSGMGNKSGSGSGMNKPDHISESLKNNFFQA
jgi:hypothetical protein